MLCRTLVLVALVTMLGLIGGIVPASKAQAVNSCKPACGTGRFCCVRSEGTAVCVTDACLLGCSGPCCLVDCHWTCCAPKA
jgi:hypothetical protein